jgi:histidine triad (HIT) family protein
VDCVFCGIVAGAAADRVWEDADMLAFLDSRPVFFGHTLVIPRSHVPALTDLSPPMLVAFGRAMQFMAGAVERGMDAGGTFIAINNKVSQSVPHLHGHVIPRTKGDGLRGFLWPRQRYASPEESASVALRIARACGPAAD